MNVDTQYITTDLDLQSSTAFDTLHRELSQSCKVLHYISGDDGQWYAVVEVKSSEDSVERDAAMDIMVLIDAISVLSPEAKAEFEACSMREFNIGFACWDTWAYPHTLPSGTVQAIATAKCSLGVTLYPMRNPDGSPR